MDNISKTKILETSKSELWQILTLPAHTKHYMFGCSVNTDWNPGASIEWKGSYQGQEQYLVGKVLDYQPETYIAYTNFDPAGSMEDIPENYLKIEYSLKVLGPNSTQLQVTTSNIGKEESRAKEVEMGWEFVLENIAQYCNHKKKEA